MAEIFADAFNANDISKVRVIMKVSLEVEPKGCILADLGGEAIGLGCIFFYGELAWIGNMAVKKKFQKRGIGFKIFSKLLEIADSYGVETVGLDATEVGRKLYRKCGFKDLYSTIAYSLHKGVVKSLNSSPKKIKVLKGDVYKLKELDSEVFGYDRWRAVEAWLRHGSKLVVAEEGYALVKGSGIGPLIANSLDEAKSLLSKAIMLGGKSIIVPAGNKRALEFIQALNPVIKHNCIRMNAGAPLKENLSKIFGILHYAKG